VTRRLLVITSVHPADDPRIRFKYLATLAADFDIVYATKAPAPTEHERIAWHRLRGGRVARWFGALWLMLTAETDIVVVHDPELLPAAIVTALLRRTPVVFDLHESLPGQMRTKKSVPSVLRRPMSNLAQAWLNLAGSNLEITLAEAGYGTLFRTARPVFANYPLDGSLPPVLDKPREGVIYVGDVNRQRGAVTLLEAAAGADVGPVVYVGRCNPTLRRQLLETAAELGVEIDLRGWMPYAQAMEVAGGAVVGVSPLHDTPNYRNSLPTKTLEYLAMGTPVIASDLPGTAAVIGGLRGVCLVPPGDVARLAAALRTQPTALAADALQGATDIRSQFRWPEDDVRAFYASL
jgi:glycosyltransferase involved in cell wall biosynthesis